MTEVTIYVTQDDIDEGAPGEGCYCPVALAVARILPRCPELVVNGETIVFYASATCEDCIGEAVLPAPAQAFIERFDNMRPVEPLRFPLDVPDGLYALYCRMVSGA